MGIAKQHINIFCMEQKKYPHIKGDVLTLGQQAVYSTLDDARTILDRNGLRAKELPTEFDSTNKIPAWKGTKYDKNTNAHSLLSLLGANNVYVTDISTYENPDFLIDMNTPVANTYHQRFDTIVDAGTLEHVFDVPVALKNIYQMLKCGGSIILILPCSNAIDHGFYSFSPTLFFDFFSANGFSNMSCYLREVSPYNFEKKGRLYKYEHVGGEIPLLSSRGVEITFVATKNNDISQLEIQIPIQSVYKNNEYWNTSIIPTSSKISTIKRIKKYIARILQQTTNYYPFFIEKIIYSVNRSNNLKYLGKY